MKKFFILSLVALLATMSANALVKKTESQEPSATCYRIVVDENSEIVSVNGMSMTGVWAWGIRDTRGVQNIRDRPNGKKCMTLKAYTNYTIYTDERVVNGWLRIQSIYNETEGRWVNLHSSRTGLYWVAKSCLYMY